MQQYQFLLQAGQAMSDEKILIAASGARYGYVQYADLCKGHLLHEVIPVGSVEFVRRYAEVNDIALPEIQTYPPQLEQYLGRRVWACKYSEVPAGVFCKPLSVKRFTGGIRRDIAEAVNPDEPVLAAEALAFEAEFRFYIHDSRAVGSSRYDDGDVPAEPDGSAVSNMIAAFDGAPIAYALDVGLVQGRTILVEVNDAWSLGYYRWGNMTPRAYMDMIAARWIQIVEAGA
jgi:hypothetical protein